MSTRLAAVSVIVAAATIAAGCCYALMLSAYPEPPGGLPGLDVLWERRRDRAAAEAAILAACLSLIVGTYLAVLLAKEDRP